MQSLYVKKLHLPATLVLSCCFLISGCASFGEGVTKAILDNQELTDTRVCQVYSKSIPGLYPYVDNSEGTLKLMMLHGIGNHIPGYSTLFMEKLAAVLDLNVKSANHKKIKLSDPADGTRELGSLRVTRLQNKNRTRELLFYELTWSEITAEPKNVLAYDNSGEYSFRRADINNLLKTFSNDTVADPILYLGDSRESIQIAFAQSFCWMITADWNELPEEAHQPCNVYDKNIVNNLQYDHYAIVSHSMGSRIVIDGLQRIAMLLGDKSKLVRGFYKPEAAVQGLRNLNIPVYMLSNQLPLLQLGRKPAEVTGKENDYCRPEGKNYHQRMLKSLTVTAFSDPNDIASYAIPHGFVEKYLDSRLCINVSNVNINLAKVFDLFGFGTMSNPIEAHLAYDSDDRVVALIAKGIGNAYTDAIINERCMWIEISE